MRRFDDHPRHIKEARKAAMCDGKQALDRKTANRVIRETTKLTRLESYKCPFCGHWHIGTRKEP
jgi:hypothetical protein